MVRYFSYYCFLPHGQGHSGGGFKRRHTLAPKLPRIIAPVSLLIWLVGGVFGVAHAESGPLLNDFYAGLGLGMAHLHPSENASGWQVTDDQSSSYQILLGYQFHPRWFAELSYTNLGEAEVTPNNNLLSSSQQISYTVPALNLGFNVFDPSQRINAFIKLGLATTINEHSGDRLIFEQSSNAQWLFSAGVSWRWHRQWQSSLEFTNYSEDAQGIMLSLNYQFAGGRTWAAGKVSESDRDGVSDATDECPDAAAGIAVNKKGCSPRLTRPIEYELNVRFGDKSSVVEKQYYAEIGKVAEYLRYYPETELYIEAHTDDLGGREANHQLSQARAMAIAAVLRDKMKIDPKRMTAVGYGETHPVDKSKTPQARERNRRVVMRLQNSHP